MCDKTGCPNKMAKIISDPADFIPIDLMHKRSCLFDLDDANDPVDASLNSNSSSSSCLFYNNVLLNKDFLHQIFSAVASIFFSTRARLH